MMLRVTDGEEGVGLSWCRFVPIALDEQSFAGAGSIDVFPCLRGAVGELIRSRADYGAVLVMQLFDLIEATALVPARNEPELSMFLVNSRIEVCACWRLTGVAAASLGPGKSFKSWK